MVGRTKTRIMKNPLFVPKSIRTFSGKYVNVFKPNLSTLNIIDVAHSLSMQTRFGGHSKVFYSIAEHSLWVAKKLQKDGMSPIVVYAGLMHDSSEAYLVDIPKPIKLELPDYNRLEDSLTIRLAKKFQFEYPFPVVIKKIDKKALKYEWNKYIVADNPVQSMSQAEAKKEFLKMYYDLTRTLRRSGENADNVNT
jgi:hypothetical protein